MTSRRRALLLQAAAGGAFDPLSYGSPLRAFWAEDPDWSSPSDGADVTSWRDAGSLGEDLIADGTVNPTFDADGIGGRPAVSFNATSETVGGVLRTVGTTSVAPPFSVVVVARARTVPVVGEYFTDARTTSRAIVGPLSSSWRVFNNTPLSLSAGTPDTLPHVFVARFETDNMRLFIDSSLVGSDLAGTASTVGGFVLGGDRTSANQLLDGLIAFAAMYPDNITAETWFSEFQSGLIDMYGV